MMLAVENKIQGSKNVEKVIKNGKIIQGDDFGVAFLKRGDDLPSKFAFVISTKISKLSVHRNRINRSLNEGVRRILKEIPKGYDFVFLTKKSIGSKTTEEIIESVRSFFSKLKLD